MTRPPHRRHAALSAPAARPALRVADRRAGVLLRVALTAALLAACFALAGCATSGDEMPPPVWSDYGDMDAAVAPAAIADGAIYGEGRDVRLFEDIKARRVGDILTINLIERTDARKSATTSTSRDDELDLPNPLIAGGNVSIGGRDVLNSSIETSRAFNGQGDSAQSNSLTGSITVTVAGVTPTGNLIVRGEKWININQGQEFIRLTGIVRPFDIQTDNSVRSDRVANARIAYSGRGAVARANTQGWLSRLFDSPVFPL